MLDPEIRFDDVESNNITNHLKKEFRKVFIRLYDQFDVIESLSEMHAIYHVRFVKTLLEGPVGINPIGTRDTHNSARIKSEAALNRAIDKDAYSPGPIDEMLLEEVWGFIHQQDGASLTDLNTFALSFGATKPQLRYVLKKLTAEGRVGEMKEEFGDGRFRLWYVPSENFNLPPVLFPV